MSNGTAFINGTFSWSGDNIAFRFYPIDNLSYNSTFVCTVGPNSEDLAGNKLGVGTTWTFLTGGEEAEEKEPIEEFWYYLVVIFTLLIIIGVMYTKNKYLTTKLRKARVDNKKLKRHMKKLDPNYQGEQKAKLDEGATKGDLGKSEAPELKKPDGDATVGEGEKPEVTEPEADASGEVESSESAVDESQAAEELDEPEKIDEPVKDGEKE